MDSPLNWDDTLIVNGNLWNTNATHSIDFSQVNTGGASESISGIDLALWLTLFFPEMFANPSPAPADGNGVDNDVNVGDIDFGNIDFSDGQEGWAEYQEQLDEFVTELNNFDPTDYFNQLVNELGIDFLGIDATFFEDYISIFDGVEIDLSDNSEIFFADIDITFLSEVNEVLEGFEIIDYIDTLFEASTPDPERLTDLNVLLQNLDELTSFSAFVKNALLRGTAGADVIRGKSANDILLGLEGNDTLRGQRGDDLINGGEGNDVLKGKGGNDLLFGNRGQDVIKAGRGDDILVGGEGRDVLTGGGGSDIYVLQGDPGVDKINGFKLRRDTIQLLDNIDVKDLELLGRRGGTMIRFGQGAEFKGRLAWVKNLSPDQFSIEDIISTNDTLPSDDVGNLDL